MSIFEGETLAVITPAGMNSYSAAGTAFLTALGYRSWDMPPATCVMDTDMSIYSRTVPTWTVFQKHLSNPRICCRYEGYRYGLAWGTGQRLGV